jgi:hypothetical protein
MYIVNEESRTQEKLHTKLATYELFNVELPTGNPSFVRLEIGQLSSAWIFNDSTRPSSSTVLFL